ncbi:MAG: hypothetical protein JWL85_518 [Candidatus Saccharibacteria bacterium]|nr:hypothetical protein [Candidatus Saccharibacteria bacterium]
MPESYDEKEYIAAVEECQRHQRILFFTDSDDIAFREAHKAWEQLLQISRRQ